MTDSYATAKVAYRELRSMIGPWAKANDYRRWAGTQSGWQKPVDAEQRLLFKFEGDTFGPNGFTDTFEVFTLRPSLSSNTCRRPRYVLTVTVAAHEAGTAVTWAQEFEDAAVAARLPARL
jgi:hypothetical protein